MTLSKLKLSGAAAVLTLLPAVASAQLAITKVGGDGQIAAQFALLGDPLAVLVTSNGVPLANAPVNWVKLEGPGEVTPASSLTDAEGIARANFVTGQVFVTTFAQTKVSASVSDAVNTVFTLTSVATDESGFARIRVQVIYPDFSQLPLVGGPGQTGVKPVQVRVASSLTDQGIPNVAVRIRQDLAPNIAVPQISCSGGVSYTEGDGVANCPPFFSGAQGSGSFTIFVGGTTLTSSIRSFQSLQFTVTKGPLSILRVRQGNNQSGPAGSTLPVALIATAEDLAGNKPPDPLPTLVWEAVTPNTLTFLDTSTVPNAVGDVGTRVRLGNIPGTFQVRVRNQSGSVQALFNVTVSVSFTGLTKASGDLQDAVINTNFPAPLVARVTTEQGTIAGIQVQFTVTSNNATITSPNPALTDATGLAQVSLQAGANPGAVTVTAQVANLTTTFNLTQRLPGPGLTQNSFFNAASNVAGGVTPLGLVAVYAAGLAPGIQGCVVSNTFLGPLAYRVATVEFTFGNLPAPIHSVCNLGPGQEYAVVQVPADLPGGGTTVTARVGGGSTSVSNIQVVAASPGLFQTLMSDGKLRVVAVRPDGSYVSLQNPARRGEIIRIYVTGMGVALTPAGTPIGTNQAGVEGNPASPAFETVVGLNNEGIPNVVSTLYAENMVGVFMVTWEVPQSAPSGSDVPFVVAQRVGDRLVFSQPSAIPIQ